MMNILKMNSLAILIIFAVNFVSVNAFACGGQSPESKTSETGTSAS